jgi:hypothetical protein
LEFKSEIVLKNSETILLAEGIKAMNDMKTFGNTQISNLEAENKRKKMFMNMVIHDLRNPTVSIKLGL